MNWFRLKTCIKCQGDLASDNGDWLCLQCGTYYYTGLYQLPSHVDDGPKVPNPPISNRSEQPEQKLMGTVAASMIPTSQSPAPRTITAVMDAAVAAL